MKMSMPSISLTHDSILNIEPLFAPLIIGA